MEHRRVTLHLKFFVFAVSVAPFTLVWAVDLDVLDKSVVLVSTDSGGGSGTVVAVGVVLTNEHVINGTRRIKVGSKHTGGNGFGARILWQNADLDLAILRVDGLTLPSVKLATRKPDRGEGVWAIGFPSAAITSRESTINSGVVSVIASMRRYWGFVGNVDIEVIQHDAAVNPGNSGGPLFDRCGRQVGVNSATTDSAQGVSLAVRITESIPHLEGLGFSLQKEDTACTSSAEVPGLDEALRETHEAARQAREQAREAEQVAIDAKKSSRINSIIGAIIGVFALLAPIFMLHKLRQQILQAMKRISRPIRERLPAANVFSRLGIGKRVALVLTGFDAVGKKLRIKVPTQSGSTGASGYVIGRHAALVDYAVEDASISRRHLRILVENEQCHVEDVNSTNGTRVNNTSLQAFVPHPILQGDTILLGTVELRVSG